MPEQTAGREQPPVTKYEYTLTVHGNSHQEITDELQRAVRGGYLLDSDYESRDEFKVIGGRSTSALRHTNPDMTAERYEAELSEWFERRKQARRSSAREELSRGE